MSEGTRYAETRKKYRTSARGMKARRKAQNRYRLTPLGLAYAREYQLKKKFGITIADYERMLGLQNGVCAICCGTNPSGKALAVDHNHETNELRELLCSKCNTMIGLARESGEILLKGAAYIEKHYRRQIPTVEAREMAEALEKRTAAGDWK